MSTPLVGFAGMTHLGLCSAVAAAERGFQVVCFDPDETRIEELEAGKLPVVEPDLETLLQANRRRVRFTAKASDLAECPLVYVAPDVPTDQTGESDLSAIEGLLSLVERERSDDSVEVILSQVPPGFTRCHRSSGGELYYQVETLVFGQAMHRALHPERFIVGSLDPAGPLPQPYTSFLEAFGCPILIMRYESAELCKIAINACLVASISAANTLAELCEGIGADWSEIAPALRLDRRIGPHAYLTPGLGIAGGNLERDLATIQRLAAEFGSDAGVVRAWVGRSRRSRDWVLRVLHREVLSHQRQPRIAVLGLAYKEDTASTKNSPAVALIDQLEPFELRVYDPVVPAATLGHPRVQAMKSALDACAGADVVLIMTPWREFRELEPALIAQKLSGHQIVDPYGVLDSNRCTAAGLDYFRLGSPPARAQKARRTHARASED